MSSGTLTSLASSFATVNCARRSNRRPSTQVAPIVMGMTPPCLERVGLERVGRREGGVQHRAEIECEPFRGLEHELPGEHVRPAETIGRRHAILDLRYENDRERAALNPRHRPGVERIPGLAVIGHAERGREVSGTRGKNPEGHLPAEPGGIARAPARAQADAAHRQGRTIVQSVANPGRKRVVGCAPGSRRRLFQPMGIRASTTTPGSTWKPPSAVGAEPSLSLRAR